MGKQLVENVLSKFSCLKKKQKKQLLKDGRNIKKKTRKKVAERRKEDKENRNKISASQS